MSSRKRMGWRRSIGAKEKWMGEDSGEEEVILFGQ
jgi:hypothetical protein